LSDLASNVHVVLQDAGFDTWTLHVGEVPAVGFEDEAVMGFVSLFETSDDLLAHWRRAEADLLARYAPSFRGAGEKAWNVYCAFFTAARSSDSQARAIRLIQEDLERTRKITGTALLTRADVEAALLPLLPIVSKPILEPEDPVARLRRRIASIAPGAEALVLDTSVTPDAAARTLGRPT
jgi:hypothetical protein